MYTGGIETLIVRMSNWLIENDNKVELLLIRGEGDLLPVLHPEVKLHFLGNHPYSNFIKSNYTSKFANDYSVIYAFSPNCVWMAMMIANNCSTLPILLNGIYHPYDYKYYANWYEKYIFKWVLPDENKVFMTSQIKKEHDKIINREIINPIIWPLAIDATNYAKINRIPKKFKIVSIGRLHTFKTYNINMLNIIKELIEEGYNIQYDIYGNGSAYSIIESRICGLGLNNFVHLKGTLEYKQFMNVLKDAYIFVGMGTSVIEAGLCSVPSITAIAYSDEAVTYGFIHELKDLNCGEPNANLKLHSIKDYIVRVLKMDDQEYSRLCTESMSVLRASYDLNRLMNELLDRINTPNLRKRKKYLVPFPVVYVFLFWFKNRLSEIRIFIRQMFVSSC